MKLVVMTAVTIVTNEMASSRNSAPTNRPTVFSGTLTSLTDVSSPATCCSRQAKAPPSPGTPSAPRVWRPAVAASGVDFHVRVHDLRHAHASWLLAGGSDLKSVMDRMGHAQITTTQKYPRMRTDPLAE